MKLKQNSRKQLFNHIDNETFFDIYNNFKTYKDAFELDNLIKKCHTTDIVWTSFQHVNILKSLINNDIIEVKEADKQIPAVLADLVNFTLYKVLPTVKNKRKEYVSIYKILKQFRIFYNKQHKESPYYAHLNMIYHLIRISDNQLLQFQNLLKKYTTEYYTEAEDFTLMDCFNENFLYQLPNHKTFTTDFLKETLLNHLEKIELPDGKKELLRNMIKEV